eukprot:880873-Amphidinium_carterae.2
MEWAADVQVVATGSSPVALAWPSQGHTACPCQDGGHSCPEQVLWASRISPASSVAVDLKELRVSDPAATLTKEWPPTAFGSPGSHLPLDGWSAKLLSLGSHRKCNLHPVLRLIAPNRRMTASKASLEERPLQVASATVMLSPRTTTLL